MPRTTTKPAKDYFSVQVSAETREELRALARANERSVAAELRLAIKRHLEESRAA